MANKIYFIDKVLEIITSGYVKTSKINGDFVNVERKGKKMKVSIEDIFVDKNKAEKRLFEVRVINGAERYGLKARWMNTGALEIISKWKSEYWLCKRSNNGRLLLLHKNEKDEGYKFHTQREFGDYFQVIDSIQQHDRYGILDGTKNKMSELFDKIKTNSIPQWKIS